MKYAWSVFWRVFVLQFIAGVLFTIAILPLVMTNPKLVMSADFVKAKVILLPLLISTVIFLIGRVFDKGVLHFFWGKNLSLSVLGWKSLNMQLVTYYLAVAFVQMVGVAFLAENAWVNFKLLSPLVLLIGFLVYSNKTVGHVGAGNFLYKEAEKV